MIFFFFFFKDFIGISPDLWPCPPKDKENNQYAPEQHFSHRSQREFLYFTEWGWGWGGGQE